LPLTFSGGNPNANGTLWHDRAVYHFLTTPADRARYREVLLQAIRPGSRIIIATFASDGPTHCSGLPAAGYDSDGLVAALGVEGELLASSREVHHTPFGTNQPITWVALRRDR